MNIVLLAGGSGKLLWPLSNGIQSKQFLSVFRTPDGQSESMLQRVYRQIRQADPEAAVTVATAKNQVAAVRRQLGGGCSGLRGALPPGYLSCHRPGGGLSA